MESRDGILIAMRNRFQGRQGRKRRGQIATLAIIVMVVLLLLVLAIAILGKVSMRKINLEIGVDRAALTLGSTLGSMSKKYSEECCDGDMKGDWQYDLSLFWEIIAFIVAIIIIIIAAYTGQYEVITIVILVLAAIIAAGIAIYHIVVQDPGEIAALNRQLAQVPERHRFACAAIQSVMLSSVDNPIRVVDSRDMDQDESSSDTIGAFTKWWYERLEYYENSDAGVINMIKTALNEIADYYEQTWKPNAETFSAWVSGTFRPLVDELVAAPYSSVSAAYFDSYPYFVYYDMVSGCSEECEPVPADYIKRPEYLVLDIAAMTSDTMSDYFLDTLRNYNYQSSTSKTIKSALLEINNTWARWWLEFNHGLQADGAVGASASEFPPDPSTSWIDALESTKAEIALLKNNGTEEFTEDGDESDDDDQIDATIGAINSAETTIKTFIDDGSHITMNHFYHLLCQIDLTFAFIESISPALDETYSWSDELGSHSIRVTTTQFYIPFLEIESKGTWYGHKRRYRLMTGPGKYEWNPQPVTVTVSRSDTNERGFAGGRSYGASSTVKWGNWLGDHQWELPTLQGQTN